MLIRDTVARAGGGTACCESGWDGDGLDGRAARRVIKARASTIFRSGRHTEEVEKWEGPSAGAAWNPLETPG